MYFKYCTVNNSCVESPIRKKPFSPKPVLFEKGIVLLFDLMSMLHRLIDSLRKGKINLSLGMESGHEGHGVRS